MMSNKFVIGISGYAKSGKDTLCELLKDEFERKGISSLRIALADELKLRIQPELLKSYQIDILNCTPEEKEIVRPALVAYGRQKRQQSKGTFWTKIVSERMEERPESVIIVPDVRYCEYPEDEVQWVQNTHKGILIHVSRYTETDGQKVWFSPPNEDEADNDPRLRNRADFVLSWPTAPRTWLADKYSLSIEAIVELANNELSRRARLTANK